MLVREDLSSVLQHPCGKLCVVMGSVILVLGQELGWSMAPDRGPFLLLLTPGLCVCTWERRRWSGWDLPRTLQESKLILKNILISYFYLFLIVYLDQLSLLASGNILLLLSSKHLFPFWKHFAFIFIHILFPPNYFFFLNFICSVQF